MTGRKTALASLLIVLATAAPCMAEGGDFLGKKACIFTFTDASGTDVERGKTITDAVILEFQAAGFLPILPDQAPITGGDQRPEALIAAARGYGADIAVSGFFTTDFGTETDTGRILVCVSCYDVSGEGLIGGFIRDWRFNLGFYNSLHAEVADLLSRLSFAEPLRGTPPVGEPPAADGLREMRFTSSQDGMEVLLSGESRVGAVENGKLAFYSAGMKPGTPLLIEKRKEGYHTARQTVDAREEMPLSPLVVKTSYALELASTFGQLFGFGAAARWYIVPDSLFGCVSLYPYLQAPLSPAGSGVLHVDMAVLLGQYVLFPAEFPFRAGVSAGVGGILTLIASPGMPVLTDFYLNPINAWLELNLPGMAFFIRTELKYTLGLGSNALGRRILGWFDIPPITLGVVLK